MERHIQALVDLGHATRLPSGRIRVPSDFIVTLERAEVTRVGRVNAAK